MPPLSPFSAPLDRPIHRPPTTGLGAAIRKVITRLPLIAALLTALFAVGPVAAVSAEGRQLVGQFCTNPHAQPKPGACMFLSYGSETAVGYTDAPNRVLTLRPGTYWLSVNDTSTAHNFSLRSQDGLEQAITGVADTPGWVTVEVHLTHGTYVLFCAADDHEKDGMYVDIEVGGVGQVG
jgi:predicted membrane-bound mannosyltransferase